MDKRHREQSKDPVSKRFKGTTTLLETYPNILNKWHSTKNEALTPDQVSPGSKRKVWWICRQTCNGNSDCRHEWQASVDKGRKQGCPFCANKQICCSQVSLEHPKYAALVQQWHPTLNGTLRPSDFRPGSNKRVWWLCPKSCGEECKHEWEGRVQDRAQKGRGCGFCAGQKPCCSRTSLEQKGYEFLVAQWHPTLNGKLTPSQVMPGSHQKVWWICPKRCPDNPQCQHIWKALVSTRGAHGCPCCSRRQACCEETSLDHPQYADLKAQWHPTKNGTQQPGDFRNKSNQVVWWLCPKACKSSPTCRHEWQAAINNVTRKPAGCPFCYGRYACCPKKSLLQAPYALLVSQWHPTKNGDLTPSKVRPGSNLKVWWICSQTCQDSSDCQHVWETTVTSRTGSDVQKGNGCPFCSHRSEVPCCRKKSLEGKYPKVSDTYADTNPVPVDQIYSKTAKKVWWTCPKGHPDYQARVMHRTYDNSECPRCNQSQMEKAMEAVLQNMPEITNVEFNGPLGARTGQHRDLLGDFVITVAGDIKAVIEMDGEQHFYMERSFWKDDPETFDDYQQMDREKNMLCRDINIPLLRISFSIPRKQYESLVRRFLNTIQEEKGLTWTFVVKGSEYENVALL